MPLSFQKANLNNFINLKVEEMDNVLGNTWVEIWDTKDNCYGQLGLNLLGRTSQKERSLKMGGLGRRHAKQEK